MPNEVVKAYFDKNAINPEEIAKKVDINNKTSKEVNIVFDRYGIFTNPVEKEISIGNIIGCDSLESSKNVYESMNYYYDNSGRIYHVRANKNLEMTPDEMLASINANYDLMDVKNLGLAGEEKYLINNNGLHRFTALRCAYLSELAKNPEQEASLKAKYTVKAVVNDIDHIKTFSNFFLSRYANNESLKREIDDDYKGTDNSSVIIDGQKQVLNDDELIELVKPIVEQQKEALSESNIPGLQEFMDKALIEKEAHNVR